MTHAMGWVTTFSYPTGSNACEYALDETTLLDVATLVHAVRNHVVSKVQGFQNVQNGTYNCVLYETLNETDHNNTSRTCGQLRGFVVRSCTSKHTDTLWTVGFHRRSKRETCLKHVHATNV